MGLFFAAGIASIFSAFPEAIIGAMMFLVGIELVRFARDLQLNRELVPLCVTVAGALIANMAVGFAAGIIVYYLFPDRGQCRVDTQL